MINTPITKRAREIAQRVFAGKTDITGYPYMRMREAVAGQMKDEHTDSNYFNERGNAYARRLRIGATEATRG